MASLISVLLFLIVIAAICYVAFWIIDSAFPAPIQVIAKVIVGVLALVILIQHFFPAFS